MNAQITFIDQKFGADWPFLGQPVLPQGATFILTSGAEVVGGFSFSDEERSPS